MASRGVNKVFLLGRLGKDPEIRSFPNGGKIANTSLATTQSWKDKNTGQVQERIEWHRVVFSGPTADTVERYLKKGATIYVEGAIRTRKWQDSAGVDRYSTEVHSRRLELIDAAAGSENIIEESEEEKTKEEELYEPPPFDEDEAQNTKNQSALSTASSGEDYPF